MRIVNVTGLFGEPIGREIALSKAERAALLRASEIAKQMRDLARTVHPDYESEDWDTEIAHVEHSAREVATERTEL